MRPVLCDVCGRMERTSYSGSQISYSPPRVNGVFYPEDLCDMCTIMLIDTLTQARREEVERQQKAQQQGQQVDIRETETAEEAAKRLSKDTERELEEAKKKQKKKLEEDDNNPATQ